jgi:crotonobetainyl-CoA:carnitine CoA-transferase CaiB-like acyl-CoA transferase
VKKNYEYLSKFIHQPVPIMQQTEFFSDLIVVELASVLAGPAVGMFFAELGARVIKVENKPSGGDVTRRWKLPTEEATKEDSAYYRSVNWGKETVFLDFGDADDQLELRELLREADILVCNLKPKALQKFQLTYTAIRTINPKIIFAQLTAFGAANERLGFDVVLQAEAGFLYMNGEPTRPPVKMPVALIDLLAAHQLKEGILLALLHKERTGKGSYLHVSLLDTAIASLANQATNWLIGKHIPQRMGTQHPNIAPYGDVFYTKDEVAIILAVGSDQQFLNLCALLQLAVPQRFIKNTDRVAHREELKAFLSPSIALWKADELLPKMHRQGIPVGRIRNMQEVFEQEAASDLLLDYSDGQQIVRSVAFDLTEKKMVEE